MRRTDAVARLMAELDDCSIPFALGDSFCTSFYGAPNSYDDADFLVQADSQAIAEMIARLGSEFQLDAFSSSSTESQASYVVVSWRDHAFAMTLLFLSDDAHDCERFRRRRRTTLFDRSASIFTAEDALITKLRWAKYAVGAMGIDDALAIASSQLDALDWPYVEEWCDRLDLHPLLDDVRSRLSIQGRRCKN